MQPVTTLIGIAAPLLIDDINTDQITPAQASRSLHPDYAAAWFSRWRIDANGNEIADFVLNKQEYRGASILVAGRNFGCGSAREGAVWAMVARGVRCIIARSFADLYRANCIQNGVLPVVLPDVDQQRLEILVQDTAARAPFTIDLQTQHIIGPDAQTFTFDIDTAERTMLLKGLDDIGLSLTHAAEIDRWERETVSEQPWLQTIPR